MKNKPTRLLWKLRLQHGRSLQFTPNVMLVELLDEIACYDTNSGRFIFRQKVVSWTSYKALLRDKELLLLRQVGTSLSLLEGLDLKTGKKLWELELPGASCQAKMLGDIIAIPDQKMMRVYKLAPSGSPNLSTLYELSLPPIEHAEYNTSFLESSQHFVGVGSECRSLVFGLHDGSVIWDSAHLLQWLAPWGWLAVRHQSYALDLFDPSGNLLKTLHDPRVTKNNPDAYHANGRGYQAIAADDYHIALTSKLFTQMSGFGSEGLYLFARDSQNLLTLKDRSSPCIYLDQDTIYLSDSNKLQALEKTHQERWSISQESWKRWQLEKITIGYLATFKDKLYGITQREVFCLA
jgi:hypothetical protein